MDANYDMTNGSIGDKTIRFALPLAVTGILQQLFNAADIAVVGRFAGKEAMAAVGSNAPVIGLLVNLFVGISLGSNVVIAKAIGQKNRENVSKAVHTSIVVAVLAGILLTVLGESVAQFVVRALDVPEEVFPFAVKYLRIYLLGMPVILLYNFESAIFRSSGDTKIPLIALVISGIINVILNLFFVVGMGMDVDGVAIATVLANCISSLILFLVLVRTDRDIRIRIRNLMIHKEVFASILKIGIPAGIQGMIFSLANVVIQSAVNSLGTTVMAASSAAYNLEIFAYYVISSFGQTCTTFIGQNYGAGKNGRCKKILKLTMIQCFISAALVCTLILLFSAELLGIFNRDAEVISVGRVRLQYIFFAYIFSVVQEVLSGYLRGFGVSFIPAACSVVGICGVRLVWIFTVFKITPAFSTVMYVYPISLGVTALAILVVILLIKPSQRYKAELAP